MVSRAKTILVVDDEADLRDLIAQVLHRTGYEVLEASSSREALSICYRNEVFIDLVISDCNMPDGNGIEILGERLRTCYPSIQIIFM